MKVLPVIHIKSGQHAVAQAALALQLGCDGVFLINHKGDDQLTLAVAKIISLEFPDCIIGVNFLSMRPVDAVTYAASMNIRHVWLDHAGIHSNNPDHKLQADLAELARIHNVTVYAGAAFKYQQDEPDPEAATLQAVKNNFITTTSGAGTGISADLSKIERMSKACNGNLAVASGLTPKNIKNYAPWISFALVATGVSTPDDELDPSLLLKFIENAKPPLELRIEATSRTEQDHQVKVDCPVCAFQQELHAKNVATLGGQPFKLNDWYSHQCVNCQRNFKFTLEFAKVDMVAGRTYKVLRPAYSFGVVNGKLVNFEPMEHAIRVEKKPSIVLVDDGAAIPHQEVLPEHLEQPDWHLVRYLDTNNRGWLNTKGCLITAINSI